MADRDYTFTYDSCGAVRLEVTGRARAEEGALGKIVEGVRAGNRQLQDGVGASVEGDCLYLDLGTVLGPKFRWSLTVTVYLKQLGHYDRLQVNDPDEGGEDA